MSKQTFAIIAVATTVSAIGLLPVCGCRSGMAVREGERPPTVSGAVDGEYILEKIVANDCGVAEEDVRAAIQKDATLQSVFRGKAESKDALPIAVTVERVMKDANGDVATVNNLVALCTLSLWPCVDSKELDYTLTASSVVGTRKTTFKVMNRVWFGLSPIAMIPVPGIGDVRGEDKAVEQFHVAQIAEAVKVLCAGLPDDYAAFKKDQSKYLEEISQARSEVAFAAFSAADTANKKTAALAKVVNATVIAKHQNDLIAAFKSNSDKAVRAAILTKLNDGSFDRLPYHPTLLSYWTKISDSRLLAQIYRDGYAKLSEADRKSLVTKISDDAVLTEMVSSEDYALYVVDAKARTAIYRALKPKMVKKIAEDILTAHKLSDWNNKDVSGLESVADMSIAVADKNVSAEIAISLACKVDSYCRACKSSWSYRWTDEDNRRWATLREKIAPALTDDILVSKIKVDRELWSALSGLISDKSKVSALAYEFVAEAAKTGKEGDVKKAWKAYGDDISDDDLLMKLSVGVMPLRRAAFVKIKDEAVKEKTLAAIKDALNADLKRCAEKQREMLPLIAEIGNGEDLVEWIRGKSGQTELQRKQTFNQMKGRSVVLKGDVREIGRTMFQENLFVSLTVGKISMFERMNVQFNIPDKLTPVVSSWQKGETYVMRGKVTSTGGFSEDVKAENAEIVRDDDYDDALELKAEMDSIKWQIKEIDEKKMPPASATPSKFGGAVKKAAGWLKSGADDVDAAEDDLQEAAEMLKSIFN